MSAGVSSIEPQSGDVLATFALLAKQASNRPPRSRAQSNEIRAGPRKVAARPLSTRTGSSVGRRDAHGVPTAGHPSEPWRDAGRVRARAVLDRPPPHRLAEEGLDGVERVTSPHRLLPDRKDTGDCLRHPVVPAVPVPDRRARPVGPASSAIFGTCTLEAIIPAPCQQDFPGSRKVGTVSG